VVYTATVPARTRAPEGMRWVPIATLADEALPNVMRKVVAHGLARQPAGKMKSKSGSDIVRRG
jgi:A/G-specific adenine glycosylase